LKLTDVLLDLFDSLPEPDRPGAKHIPAPAPKAAPAPRPAPTPAPPRDPNVRDEAGVLAVLRRGGAEYRRVVFTRNRRIMISVGRDRAVIRMNAAFASAPESVLVNVAILFSPATKGRKKEQAKAAVRAFINALPPVPAAPRVRRPRLTQALDRPILERLQEEFDRVNRLHFGGKLPRVPIHLSRQMRRRNGHFSSQPLEIVISYRLCTRGAEGEAEHTMRHEMVHLWQYMTGAPVDHGPAFRRMAHRVDVHPRATRPVKWKGR
jgi:hypothetical protein